MDRRKSARHEIQLPARFAVRRLAGFWFTGHTLNMSRTGVLVEAADLGFEILPADEIEVELELAETRGIPPRCLCCTGHVARISATGDLQHFAVAIQAMTFRVAHSQHSFKQEDSSARFVM